MRSLSCPIASPFALSRPGETACTRGRFDAHLPANDFPLVSPHLAGASDRPAFGSIGVPVGDLEQRGVVISCPLPSPLAPYRSDQSLHPSTTPLPAKEKKNEVQSGGEL